MGLCGPRVHKETSSVLEYSNLLKLLTEGALTMSWDRVFQQRGLI